MKQNIPQRRCLSMLLSIVMTISFLANGSVAYATEQQPSNTTSTTNAETQGGEPSSEGTSEESSSDPDDSDNNSSEGTQGTDQEEGEPSSSIPSDTSETPSEESEEGNNSNSEDTASDAGGQEADPSETPSEEGEEDEEPDAEPQGSQLIYSISETVNWETIEEALEETESVTSVLFQGEGEDAVIQFSADPALDVDLSYAVTFDNVQLMANGSKAVTFYANGYSFQTTDSVTTSGTLRVFGGGNETSVSGGTDVRIYGGDFNRVVGGCYSSSTETEISVGGATTVVIGPSASATSVIGGCIGGVNYGDISVTYYADTTKKNNVIIGSSGDAHLPNAASQRGLSKSMARVDNPGGSISVKVIGIEGQTTYVGSIFGTANATVDLGATGTISAYVDTGVSYQGFSGAYGGGTNMNVYNADIVPAEKYFTYEVGQILLYEVKANFDIQINGNASGYSVSGCEDADITGNINMVVDGNAWGVIGGGYYRGDVTGNINVTVSGTMERLVVGGGLLAGHAYNLDYYRAVQRGLETKKPTADVTGDITVTLTGNGSTPELNGAGNMYYYNEQASLTVTGSVTVRVEGNAKVTGGTYYSLLGAGYVCSVTGDISITVGDYATITGGYYGAIAGGAYFADVTGSTSITLTDHATIEGSVFGGGLGGNVSGNTRVEVNQNAVITTSAKDKLEGCYGGGFSGNVGGDTYVLAKDNAVIHYDVVGGGYSGTATNSVVELTGSACVVPVDETDTNLPGVVAGGLYSRSTNTGNATIYIKENATVGGYLLGTYGSTVQGTKSVIFDGCTGSYLGIAYADLVKVTNSSNVTIHDTTAEDPDYAQFYDVTDLTIDQGGQLTLLSNAAINGDFYGDQSYSNQSDTDNRGTLVLVAGKGLAVGDSVKGWSKLSILDDTSTSTIPEEKQVYVVSGACSTLEDGGFTWIDQRNFLTLDWTSCEISTDDDEEVESNDATTVSQWWLVSITEYAIVTPVSITAYEGGTSVNGNHIPQLRYSVTTSENWDLTVNDLSFTLYTVDSETGEVTEEHLNRARIDNSGDDPETLCLFPLLDADLGNMDSDGCLDQQGTYLTLVDTSKNDTSNAGVYQIQVNNTYGTDWYITATATVDGASITYPVEFHISETVNGEEVPATVTIRKVADEEMMYDSPETYLTQVVTSEQALSAGETNNSAYALYPEDTEFLTNGSERLGLVGAGEYGYAETEDALIALLFDDITTLTADRSAQELQDMMLEYAEKEFKTSYDEWSTDFRYLDLVNANDGNIVMTADQPATIYWSYPENISAENADNYEFLILHYSGMDRENSIAIGNSLADAGVTVESISVTPTEYGLRFQTTSFSPFALLWKEKDKVTLTLVYDPNWSTTQQGTSDVTIDFYVGTEVDMSSLVIPGHTDESAISWYTSAGNTGLVDGPFTMDANKTLYAQEFYLNFNTNGGDSISRLRFNQSTDVKLEDYTPTRDGFKFTGWYADEALTKKLDGSVTVSKNTTVYAGWKEKPVTLTLVYDPLWKYIGGDNPDVTIELDKGSEVDLSTLIIPGHEDDDPVSWMTDSGDVTTIVTEPFTITEDTTLYAGATLGGDTGTEVETVTLTLVYDPLWKYIGGDNPDVTIELDKGSEVDLSTLIIPGHEDDDPVSWMTDSGDVTTIVTEPFTITEDTTLYAGDATSGGGNTGSEDPTPVTPFYLSYHSNGGSYVRTRAFTEATEVDFDDPSYIPTRDGYTFTGWYTDFSFTERLNGVNTVSTDMTVVAGWALVTFTLTFDSNGGSEIEHLTFTDATEVDFDDPNYIPTRDGYIFTGWYTENDLETLLTGTVAVSTNMTVYAGWEVISDSVEPTPDVTTEPVPDDSTEPAPDKSTEPVPDETIVPTTTDPSDSTAPSSAPTSDQETTSTAPTSDKTSPSTTHTSGTKTPSTGDQSNLTLWLVSLLASSLGLVAAIVSRKKSKGKSSGSR